MKAPQLADVLADTNLFEAWAKVRANQGCAGIDGETIEDFQRDLTRNFATLRNEVHYSTYRPMPLLRVEIDKKDSVDKRPLSIPAVRDRVLQTALALVLTPLFETEFEDCSFAYRKGRSVDQAVRLVMRLRDEGYCWVVDADIQAFFDEIDHKLLMTEVKKLVKDPDILTLIGAWLAIDIVDGKRRYRATKGVPQGSPISPLLSNLYLDHLDEAFIGKNVKLIRFADDFLVLCKTRDHAENALEMSEAVLEQLRLEINEEKTRVVDFNRGFRFLGVQFVRSLAIKAKYPQNELRVNAPKKIATDAVGPANKIPSSDAHTELPPPAPPSAASNAMDLAFSEAGISAQSFPLSTLSAAETPEDMEPVTEDEEADLPAGHDPRLRTLYLMEHGYTLGKESQRLVVRTGQEEIQSIAAIKVDQIMVFGNAQITTQAMQFCLQEHIPIYLLSAHGRYYGTIDAFSTDPVLLHRDQFVRAADPVFCLDLAREFVRGKIANCRIVLQRHTRKRDAPALQKAVSDLKAVRLDDADTLEQLRGFEGSAARCYFSAISNTLHPRWKFNGRVRQPPTDPVNAMLSYGYTLLFYNIYTFLRARGMNPHVGYLHPLRTGHPALASDIIEEFRAIVVDTVVLSLVLNERLSPKDFHEPDAVGEPCLLNKKARSVFIKALESKLNSAIRHPVSGLHLDYRRCIEHQVRHLAAHIRGRETRYQPMVLR